MQVLRMSALAVVPAAQILSVRMITMALHGYLLTNQRMLSAHPAFAMTLVMWTAAANLGHVVQRLVSLPPVALRRSPKLVSVLESNAVPTSTRNIVAISRQLATPHRAAIDHWSRMLKIFTAKVPLVTSLVLIPTTVQVKTLTRVAEQIVKNWSHAQEATWANYLASLCEVRSAKDLRVTRL
jgi:hypothetical protein